MTRRFVSIIAFVILGCSCLLAQRALELPRNIYSGEWKAGHVQGIAIDAQHKYIYYSFTSMLVKTDLQGNVVGTVTGLLGHLGCLAMNPADGRLYGTLEYKDDVIGKGILKQEGENRDFVNTFYIAIFDTDAINRVGMSAETDSVMTTVCLPTVEADYNATVQCGGKQFKHRLGCSGVDGVSFGPRFGKSRDSKWYLTVAYGVYSDLERTDNDYQVLLQYDVTNWRKFEHRLSLDNLHRFGPKSPDGQYFAFTGNTDWGIQNLEYDVTNNCWLAAVYRGKKPQYPNYGVYAIDGSKKPQKQPLNGVPYIKKGNVVSLLRKGLCSDGIYGWNFKYGSTGIVSLGDGYFYISHNGRSADGKEYTNLKMYRFVPDSSLGFELVN